MKRREMSFNFRIAKSLCFSDAVYIFFFYYFISFLRTNYVLIK
jgi:hypothetical protein